MVHDDNAKTYLILMTLRFVGLFARDIISLLSVYDNETLSSIKAFKECELVNRAQNVHIKLNTLLHTT